MKKIVYLLFVPLFSFSQIENSDKEINQVTVFYKSLLNDCDDSNVAFLYDKGQLIATKDESLYIETPLDTIVDLRNYGGLSTHEMDYKFTYYKDHKNKTIYYDRNYGLKTVIKDDNYRINWELTGRSKEVFSYNCQEAVGVFRGREYYAYYLKEIPISSGPFKFDGLPGLILQVVSKDGSVSITATSITYDEGAVSNPFQNVGNASWFEFKRYYQSRFEKFSGITKNEEELFVTSIPKRYIEFFIE